MLDAIDFCRGQAGIDSPLLLSSPFLLIVLAYLNDAGGYERTPEEASELIRWLHLANLKGRFSRGSSETLLDQDLAVVRSGKGVVGLIDRLTTQFGRLEVTPTDLAGLTQRSALFKAMFLAFRAAGATDWHSQRRLTPASTGRQHKLQFHHIFPKALLRGIYPTGEINDLCNLAFIGGRTNQSVGQRSPALYLPELIQKLGPGPFNAQCIPTDPKLLEVEAFSDFLVERRVLVAERLNEFANAVEPRTL